VNTKYIQTMDEKFDLLYKYSTTSVDGVTSLANKYEMLENRMNTFESKYTVLLFYNFLNKMNNIESI